MDLMGASSCGSFYLIKIIKRYILGYIRFLTIRIGYIPSHHVRYFLYKYMLRVNLAKGVHVYHGAEVRSPYKLTVGAGSSIGDYAILDARASIYIGKNVNISTNVSLWTHQHDYNDAFFRCTPNKIGPINVGDFVWIGPNVIILPNISIGEGAVIAAGAVVTKDVEPYSLVGGIPAKNIGYRNRDLRYNLSEYLPFY